MKTAWLLMTGLLVALPATPPASAAQKAGQTADRSPVTALLRKGLADLDRRDFDAAIKKFTKAAQLSSDCRPLFLLGLAHYERGSQGGDFDAAEQAEARQTAGAYAKAMALDPGHKVITDPARFYKSLAWSHEVLGFYAQAAAAYESAAAAAPRDPILPLQAARVYSRMGEPAKAARSLAASLERARRLKREGLILLTVRSNPRFSFMLADPDVAAVLAGPKPVNVSVAQSAPLSDTEELRDALADYAPAADRLGSADKANRPLPGAPRAMPGDCAAQYQSALAYSVSGRFDEALRALAGTFASAPSRAELRKYLLLAKSDPELESVRDLSGFAGLLDRYEQQSSER